MAEITRVDQIRGDTFELPLVASDDNGVPVNLDGYSVRSQVRDKATDELIADLVVTVDPDQTVNTGLFTLTYAGDTSLWVPGTYGIDVQTVSPTGFKKSTGVKDFVVTKDMTL